MVKQTPRFDGLSFDPFSLFQDCLALSEVDVGRGEVLQALVIAPVVVMIDKGLDLLPEDPLARRKTYRGSLGIVSSIERGSYATSPDAMTAACPKLTTWRSILTKRSRKRSQKWSQQKGNRLLSLRFFNLSGEIWCPGEALKPSKYKQFINSLQIAEK